ncbi:MAG: peptidylprolyl isomerase [Betaproteobacteria bacterium]|nr:peptidylprolyl isomerase [Betaproteobacteria bacterium]
MFDFVARNKRLLRIVLIVIIVPPFALWGLDSYTKSGTAGADIASVAGQKISEQEFGKALSDQQQRLRSALGGNIDPAMFDTLAMRKDVLDGMISQRLVTDGAVRSRLNVGDEQLREVISSMQAFQQDGKFSRPQYEAALRAEGYTAAGFENSLRRDLMTQQLIAAIGDAGIASKAVAARLAAFRVQQREVADAVVQAAQFAPQIKPDDAAIKAYYAANPRRFQVPEKVRFEYVVLNAGSLSVEPLSAEELKTFYDQNAARWGEPEQRQASHILLGFKQGATDADKAKVREKAAQLLEQLKKSPGSFAELAKKNSDDPGSAVKGGDLGYFSRGMMVKPFEDAAFSLKQGETSGLVESEFGVHIIRLTGLKAGKAKTLEQVRPEIEREIHNQKAGRKFAESAETFSNLVYEQADSLKPAAERFKLKIQEAGWTTRDAFPVPQLNNAKLRAALFSDDAIKNKRNTEAIELARGTLVSARVIEHLPAKQTPLEEVRAEVIRQIVAKESLELARKQGAEKLAALQKGGAADVRFGAPRLVTRDAPAGMPPDALTPVFRAETAKLPAYVGVNLPNGYGIFRVSKVVAKEVEEAGQRSIQTELGRAYGSLDFRAYIAALRASAKVDINQSRLEKKAN